MDGGPFATDKPISLRMHQAVDVTTFTLLTFTANPRPMFQFPWQASLLSINRIGDRAQICCISSNRTLRPSSGGPDGNGAITFLGLPQSCHLQFAMNDDRFAPLVYSDSIQLPADAKFSAGPIRLHTAGSISGKVIFGATGKPAAGMSVSEHRANKAGAVRSPAAVNGTYRINRLGPGNGAKQCCTSFESRSGQKLDSRCDQKE